MTKGVIQMVVKDFMIQDVYVARPTFTLKQLLQIMIENKIGGLPIVDEHDKLISMVTDGDILRYLAPKDAIFKDYFTYIPTLPGQQLDDSVKRKLEDTVSNLLKNFTIATVSPESQLEDVVSMISKNHFKKIPVVDADKRVVGIISRGDTLRMLYKGFFM